ncbi:hypothetical protein NBRC116602_15220 [Hyphomicrobiales bacterium 4NK60-0047b]
MNGTEFSAAFAGALSALEQIFFFLSIIFILLVGAWVTAIFSGSQGAGVPKFSTNKNRRNERGVNRHLTLHRIQGDEFGFLGEQLLHSLRKEYAGSLWSRWTNKNKMRSFHISTGHFSTRMPCKNTHQSAKNSTKGHSVEVSIDGNVKNKQLNLRFFPHGPLHIIDPAFKKNETNIQPLRDVSKYKSQQNEFAAETEPFKYVYECSDFPLFELKEVGLECPLNRKKQKADEVLFQATVAGIMCRGCGIAHQIVSLKKLSKWAKQLDEYLKGEVTKNYSKATSKEKNTEIIVVTAWCYLVAGLGQQDEQQLKRSLDLYELLSEDHWQGREKAEMAGAQSNEAYAAFALMQLNPNDQRYPPKIKTAVLKAIRNFRRDNFPHSWGKLMCKLAFAETSQRINEHEEMQLTESEDLAEVGHTFQSIEIALDDAIEVWRKNRQQDAMCEAYFAKGKLAVNIAKRNMGVQGLERAENGFLAALALSSVESRDHKNSFMKISRPDIRLELGKLYLSWGTRFGEAELIEKAIHHFEALLEEKSSSKSCIEETKLALAECFLNFGGITNEAPHHKQAIFRFNDCLDQGLRGQKRDKVERSISVARARLALLDRNKDQVITAISSICSVIGQNGKLWPTKDVLLRLRARLRELLFALEGDDIALDRAIKDRRDLVKLAESGAQDVRWAVEISDLVNLLSKRQYKNNGKQEDFNEAHYLLENAISIVEESADVEESSKNLPPELDIPHIRGTLYLNLAKLLASFARVHFDEQALNEAANYYQKFINLTPRAINPRKRAEVLSQIGLIMMDLSEQYGSHSGLKEAIASFAEAHDIYLEAGLIDLSNRMRRFLENAQAAQLAYQLPDEDIL